MKILLPLILLVAATSAFAADPFHGTWKKNKALSGGEHWVDSEAVFKFEVTEDKVIITKLLGGVETVAEYALDGTPTRRTDGRVDSLKRIHPNVWELGADTHGRIQTEGSNSTPFTEEGHYSLSHDGTILIWTQLRTYSDGNSRYIYRFLEKQ